MSDILVPELGESIVEARVARWLKKEGDRVEVGEPLVELETEKVDLEVSAERAGVLTRIARHEGDDVKIGEVLGVVDESAAPAAASPPSKTKSAGDAPATEQATAPAAPPPAKAPADRPTAPTLAGAPPGRKDDVKPTPKDDVKPTPKDDVAAPAPKGDVVPTRKDEIAPIRKDDATTRARPAAPAPSPAGARNEQRIRMSKRRETIARRLVEAQRTAAMLTTFNEVDMTAVMDLRARHKEAFAKRHGAGLGIVSFFVKAAVAALRAFPQLNAEIQGDEIVLKSYYDIGVAVGAEGGLVVPVLRDADKMPFGEMETTIRDVARRANEGALTLEDLTGGTFTVTNGGVYGSLLSTPILNPPQVGILGLHKIQDRAMPANGQVVIRPMMYVALSYDHRLVDGREAVQFLVKIKEFVEDPGHLLLES